VSFLSFSLPSFFIRILVPSTWCALGGGLPRWTLFSPSKRAVAYRLSLVTGGRTLFSFLFVSKRGLPLSSCLEPFAPRIPFFKSLYFPPQTSFLTFLFWPGEANLFSFSRFTPVLLLFFSRQVPQYPFCHLWKFSHIPFLVDPFLKIEGSL